MACQKSLTPDGRTDTRSELETRPARSSDHGALVALDYLCFGARAWPPGDWWDAVAEPEWGTTVGLVAGEVVAASVVLVWPPLASLASLAVHPAHRRQGYGLRLLRDAITRARRAAIPWIALEVDEDNAAAIALYRREGFGVARRFREDGRWRLEMVRRLGGGRGR